MGVNIFCRRRCCCLPRMTRRANHMLFVWPSPERALWLDMVCVRAHHLSSEIVCLKYAELYVKYIYIVISRFSKLPPRRVPGTTWYIKLWDTERSGQIINLNTYIYIYVYI